MSAHRHSKARATVDLVSFVIAKHAPTPCSLRALATLHRDTGGAKAGIILAQQLLKRLAPFRQLIGRVL